MSSTRDQNFAKVARIDDRFTSLEEVKNVLDSGFDINYEVPLESRKTLRTGCTALHLLMRRNYSLDNEKIIKLLCSHGANLFHKNNEGFTPLRLAYQSHRENTNLLSTNAKKLINSLLVIQLEQKNATNPRCNEGISHFHMACLVGNRRAIKFFLDHDIPIDETINSDSSVFPGCSGLHLAMFSENRSAVQLLLKHGADRIRLNARGLSPLHLIVEKQFDDVSFFDKRRQRRIEIKKNDHILAEMSKPSTRNPNPVDIIGLSHLHVCCTRKYNFNMDECKRLLNTGVNLDAPVHPESPVWPGYSALHCAARCNWDAMILLLEKGANPFAKDANGLTALDLCFDRYKPIEISRIFNACDTLKSLQLRNGSKLSDVFAAFETTKELKDYLKSVDVGTATMPLDSPLWPSWSLLHFSVKLSQKDNRTKIKACLGEGVPLIVTDENKMTALHMAFYMGKRNCVKELLRAHNTMFANLVDKNGLSHFHIACLAKNDKAIKIFLSKDVDPNTPLLTDTRTFKNFYSMEENRPLIRAGSTPLHIASITANKFLATLLLQKKADPFQPDADGLTCIHRLLESGYYFGELVLLPKVLSSNPVAPGGLSHLHVACCTNNLKAVEALLPLTANVNEPIGATSMTYFQKSKKFSCLDTPLHLAARPHKYPTYMIIDLLLKSGADVKVKNANGLNPFHLALHSYENFLSGSKEVVKRLALKYSEQGMFPDDIGLTKLHVACLKTNFLTGRTNEYNGGTKKNLFNKTVVDLLILKHKKNDETSDKMQVITTLAEKYTVEIFKSVIDKLSNVTDVDENGRNVIHCIISLSSLHQNIDRLYRNVEYLVNSGYELDLQDKEGKTPLHHAALAGNVNKIAIPLLLGADINIIDDSGKVPLEYCLDDSTPPRYKTEVLLAYASKLHAAGLFVNNINKRYLKINGNDFCQTLNEMKEIFITKSFTLRDVLTEKMVMTFPMMAKVQRQAIIDYIKCDNMKKFESWQAIFSYQRRRALNREQLYEATFGSLRDLLDPRLPDHCLDSILIHLSNEDWKSITLTADECQEMEIVES